MENNTITLKNKNGKKKTYRVILAAQCSEVGKNIIVYTDDIEKNEEKKAYAIKIDIDGKYTNVDKKEFQFLMCMLNNFQKWGV